MASRAVESRRDAGADLPVGSSESIPCRCGGVSLAAFRWRRVGCRFVGWRFVEGRIALRRLDGLDTQIATVGYDMDVERQGLDRIPAQPPQLHQRWSGRGRRAGSAEP
jgi:hypothetical protein